jgi:hypothetical protein
MPTVLRVGRYRFFFFSNENKEPPHIHIKAGKMRLNFGSTRLGWLQVMGSMEQN